LWQRSLEKNYLKRYTPFMKRMKYFKIIHDLSLMKLAIFIPALLILAVRPEVAADLGELARQVRAVETAFAKTMADRDWAAFKAHIAAEAVFFGRNSVLRGRNAVADVWKPYFAGAKAPFSWEPEQVEVLESGTLALSSGPVTDPEGKRTGTFQSIWRLEADGHWRIIFDKGCPACN
jgi:ketosteroid isomerase-like protein